jgi:hypothetical protein
LRNEDISDHSIQEKFSSVVLVIVIILFISKIVYYDGMGGEITKIAFPVILFLLLLMLIIFKQFRLDLFEWWLRKMLYLPIVIIAGIVLGIIYYFMHIIFAAGPIDPGSE